MKDKENINLGTNNLLLRLAISGKMGSGKTTLAKMMVEKFHVSESSGKAYSFASKIKEVAKDVYGMGGKDRILLQTLGDNMRQVVGSDGVKRENVWIDYLVKQMNQDMAVVKSLNQQPINILQVIDDLRYKNEYDMLKENGFMTVRIWADEATRIRRMNVDANELKRGALHKSETELDSKFHWDFVVDNNGTLEDLANCMGEIFEIALIMI